MKRIILPDYSGVRFEFDDGLPSYTLYVADMHDTNQRRMTCAGIIQRVGDEAAISKSAENGYKVTDAMRREAVAGLGDHYRSGSIEWSPKAKAKTAPQNPHIAAIAVKRGCSYEEAMKWFAAKLQAELDVDIAE